MLYSDILDDVLENKSDMQKSLCECRGIFVFAALDFTKELLGMCRGRCPHRPADLPEGSNFLVQPCRNRPAEFARFSRCPPGACQRRLLPLPVSVMLIFKSFLVQMGAFYFYGVCKFVHKPPLKGRGTSDFREVHLLVQSCQNRPAEFARCPRCPPVACQRR